MRQGVWVVYRTTCGTTGRQYIGCCAEAKAASPAYMGSGPLLLGYVDHYGIGNFRKELLSSHDEVGGMAEEARLANVKWACDLNTLNLQPGGRGLKAMPAPWYPLSPADKARLDQAKRWKWWIFGGADPASFRQAS